MQTNWKPQDKQALALARTEEEILYGGARGGGKTDAGQAWLLYDIDHPKYRALVIRKNADDLRDWIDRARYMYRGTGAVIAGNPPEIRFPRGGIIRTGHLNDDKAYTKYQGHEYQRILVEELSQIPKETEYEKLISSCRSSVPELKPQVFATTNPDDPGIDWIKNRWDIPEIPDFDKIYTKITPEKRRLVFIPAKLEDNPILMDADPNYLQYLESLKRTDYELYEAWRKGNWKGFGVEGSYFRTQLIKAEEEKRITDVPYDELLPVHTWCDLGMADSFCIGYFQVYGMQWRMINYDEFEGESLGFAIEKMREKNYFFGQHYAPHDIEVRELGTGKSRWEIAESLGVSYNVVPQMDVADGINAVRMRLSSLWFDKDKCDIFIKRLRRYHKEFDDKRGVFKNKPVHDINSHAADMMRYWAMTNLTTEEPEAIQTRPEWISRKKGVLQPLETQSIIQTRPQWIRRK
jgi:hypothetical protein